MNKYMNLEHYDNINTIFFQLLAEGFEGDRYFKQRLVMKVSAIYRQVGIKVSLKDIWADANLYCYLDTHPEHTCRENVSCNRYYGEGKYMGD